MAKIEEPEVYVYVRKDVPPLRFATINLRATEFQARYRVGKEYSKLLLEIGTPEVDIYMNDFSFFFLKNFNL